MRSHEERVAEAKRRIAKMEREKRLRRNTITAASAVAACLALIVGVSFVMPDIAVKIQTGGYAGFETAEASFTAARPWDTSSSDFWRFFSACA